MNRQNSPHHDHEALSALFDGELHGDERRFALRRLSHDEAWQQACGRWQLIGDAMRRQAPIAAPSGFAERVQARLGETQPAASPARRAPLWRRPWAGGALAASVALAALFAAGTFTRPPAELPPPAAPVAQAPAAVPAAAAPAIVPVPDRAVAVEPADAVPATTTRQAPAPASRRQPARVVAAADTARRRTRPARVEAQAIAAAPSPVAVAAALPPVDPANPFSLKRDEPIAPRPWPRSVLSGQPAGAFTASYGAAADSGAERPSFYPFEPRLHVEAQAQSPAP